MDALPAEPLPAEPLPAEPLPAEPFPAGPAEPAGPPPAWSRLRLVDLVDESILGISARPARLVLTMIGTVVGIAALVATLGLGQTAAGQIAQRFDAVTATRVVLTVAQSQSAPDGVAQPALPWDAADRVGRLAGVAAAATYSAVDLGERRVSGVDLIDPAGSNLLDIPVVAASQGLLGAEGGAVTDGRFFDAGHDRRGDPVVGAGRESRPAARTSTGSTPAPASSSARPRSP